MRPSGPPPGTSGPGEERWGTTGNHGDSPARGLGDQSARKSLTRPCNLHGGPGLDRAGGGSLVSHHDLWFRSPLPEGRPLFLRLLHALLLMLGVVTLVFFVAHLIPGDPSQLIDEHSLDQSGRELVRQRLGLDRPVLEQYGTWLASVLRGDLGTSLRQQRPVAEIIGAAWLNTLILSGVALLLELAVGVAVGVLMASRPSSRRAAVLNVGGLALHSLPSFWLGLVAIAFFARNLGWLPAGGMHAPDASWLPWTARTLDTLRHMVLPVLILGVGNYAVTARLTRTSLARVLADEWVLAARARGVPERRIVWRHALRVAALPVLTWMGVSVLRLVGGAVAVEEVFAWPGLGRVTVQALLARDYPLIMGGTLVAAVMVAIGSLLADLAGRAADPRLRLDGRRREVR